MAPTSHFMQMETISRAASQTSTTTGCCARGMRTSTTISKSSNTHDKFSAVRDSSKKATLRNALIERLRNSKNLLLIVGETTREDRDWVPFEIEKAVDTYGIPIIVAYTVYTDAIRDPEALASYWPAALSIRIKNGSASAIHVPFREAPIYDAIEQFSHQKLPIGGGLGIYSNDAYATWGIR